jgi:hypothetical protein
VVAVLALMTSALAALAARGESLAAFDGRRIPAGGVASPSNTPGILGRRALPAGRLARLGAPPACHHGVRGVTLVELRLAVALATGLVGIAVPLTGNAIDVLRTGAAAR